MTKKQNQEISKLAVNTMQSIMRMVPPAFRIRAMSLINIYQTKVDEILRDSRTASPPKTDPVKADKPAPTKKRGRPKKETAPTASAKKSDGVA